MSEREALLLEAIRRLDCAYHQLWGAICESKDFDDVKSNRNWQDVFTGLYKKFDNVMKQYHNPVVTLTRVDK